MKPAMKVSLVSVCVFCMQMKFLNFILDFLWDSVSIDTISFREYFNQLPLTLI